MYLVTWSQEDECEIIYKGNSYKEAKKLANEAIELLGSDGFQVDLYQLLKTQDKC